MSFKIGDRVTATESIQHGDGKMTASVITGEVVEVLDAQAVYPDKPIYQGGYKKEKKDTKFPTGTVVCRVKVDGEVTLSGKYNLRNFHESQLSHA